eukprot:4123237-Pleurochrysis_carterae.AAC.2
MSLLLSPRAILLTSCAACSSQPVARMHVRASGAGAALLSGDWEICLPKCDVVPVKITPLGEPIESWQACELHMRE